MKTRVFDDGAVVCCDSTSEAAVGTLRELGVEEIPLIIADPPYGNIVEEEWDKTNVSDDEFASWMMSWTCMWKRVLVKNGAFYVWGGIGKPGFRPFLKYMTAVERDAKMEIANLITWEKKRGYGVQNNYLFTREECVYLCNGNAKKPATFNVPYLEEVRGYAGYNKKYPAKSENYRRTNVWSDITEVLRGKRHPTEKAQRLYEVIIEVHTNPGDYVIDPFAGCGTTAVACRKLGRRFVCIDSSEEYFDKTVKRLETGE